MKSPGITVAAVALALVVSGCSSVARCTLNGSPDADLGGWMVDEASTFGVHQRCASGAYRFVLESVVERNSDGSVARWAKLADLSVHLRRGEQLLYGFECGSKEGVRGDVIAVVNEGTVEALRAWRVDIVERRFVTVSPGAVRCESLE